jgi:hypothetical protein
MEKNKITDHYTTNGQIKYIHTKNKDNILYGLIEYFHYNGARDFILTFKNDIINGGYIKFIK